MLERTIIQKIIEAVDTKYLAALCNPVTGQITPLVPKILDFLHNNYRRITPQQLDNKTTTVKSMTYNLAQPIEIIFKYINGLVKYARAAKVELTKSQTINLAPFILHIQRIFKYKILAWKHTNPSYKTWDNFNNNF